MPEIDQSSEVWLSYRMEMPPSRCSPTAGEAVENGSLGSRVWKERHMADTWASINYFRIMAREHVSLK